MPTDANDEAARAIAARVRAARTLTGLSRRRLAAASGVSERYLNQLEHGEANVTIGVLTRVATALGADLTTLLVDAPAGAAASPVASPGPLGALVATMTAAEQIGALGLLQRYLDERRRNLKGIALLGLRGAGKSTIGGLFARRHGLAFHSVTREIESRAGMSLPDLFNLGGPDAYRTLENDVVRDLTTRNEPIVLETAGGIVANRDAHEVILASFRTVWLKASPEEHLSRVIGQGDMRPLHGMPQALDHLKTLLAQRQEDYARADFILDTSGRTPETCVTELEALAAPLLADAA